MYLGVFSDTFPCVPDVLVRNPLSVLTQVGLTQRATDTENTFVATLSEEPIQPLAQPGASRHPAMGSGKPCYSLESQSSHMLE